MSHIQWTDTTWNPTTGCNRVSEGCRNCYAEIRAETRMPGLQPDAYRNAFSLTHHRERLQRPLEWTTPQRIFVNSMSDLFHEAIDPHFLRQVFETMHQAPWHVYQILTKRSERLLELGPQLPWADHVWMGVSVESADATSRIDDLRQCAAHNKFLSIEPLLGPLPSLDLTGIDWVIIGGESGKEARPMELKWAKDIIAQCRRAEVPVFVKQLGEIWARQTGSSHRHGGRIDDWPEHLQIREMPSDGLGMN